MAFGSQKKTLFDIVEKTDKTKNKPENSVSVNHFFEYIYYNTEEKNEGEPSEDEDEDIFKLRRQIYDALIIKYERDKEMQKQASRGYDSQNQQEEDEEEDSESSIGYLKTENNELKNRVSELEMKLEYLYSLLENPEKLHTHRFCVKAMIRISEDVNSKRVRIMPEGSMVRVVETKGNRARIDFPIAGWCSLQSKDGRCILRGMNEKKERKHSNGIRPLLSRLESAEELDQMETKSEDMYLINQNRMSYVKNNILESA
eukprot:UN29711